MSCLFNTLSTFVNINLNDLRDNICNYLHSNPHLHEDINANDYINWSGEYGNMDNYINMMKRSSTWGGAIEIKAFCNMYNIEANVANTQTGKIINFLPNTNTSSQPITINWNGGHYWR